MKPMEIGSRGELGLYVAGLRGNGDESDLKVRPVSECGLSVDEARRRRSNTTKADATPNSSHEPNAGIVAPMYLQSVFALCKYANYQVLLAEREGFEPSMVGGLTEHFRGVTISKMWFQCVSNGSKQDSR